MGKDKGNGADEEGRPRPLSEQFVSPEHPNLKSHSVTETRDQATLARSIGEIIDRATAQQRVSYETVDKSLNRAYDRIETLQKENADLVRQLAIVSAQNVSSELVAGQARNIDTDTREKWETARAVIAQMGPQAAPFFGHVARYLGPKLAAMTATASASASGSPPAAGDTSPRAAAFRVFAKLGDGSEESGMVVNMLSELAGDDWPMALAYMTETFGAPVPAVEVAPSPVVTPPPVAGAGPNKARAKRAVS